MAVRHVTCPQCGGAAVWSPENPSRPFCSERCKLIDLGAWAAETYRVPAQETEVPDVDAPDQTKV